MYAAYQKARDRHITECGLNESYGNNNVKPIYSKPGTSSGHRHSKPSTPKPETSKPESPNPPLESPKPPSELSKPPPEILPPPEQPTPGTEAEPPAGIFSV